MTAATNDVAASAAAITPRPQVSAQQIAARVRQLKLLFDEGLFTDEFYNEKVGESEAAR